MPPASSSIMPTTTKASYTGRSSHAEQACESMLLRSCTLSHRTCGCPTSVAKDCMVKYILHGNPDGGLHAGGQAKRVNIGLALAISPRVLFLDEPTSGLDSYTSHQVRS